MTRRTLEIAAFIFALLVAAVLFHSWLAAHDDQLRLQSTLASQKQAIDAADARERDRAVSLKGALSQIDALKRAAQSKTPSELARALQDELRLPQPITVIPSNPTPPSVAPSGASLPKFGSPLKTSAEPGESPVNIPPVDQSPGANEISSALAVKSNCEQAAHSPVQKGRPSPSIGASPPARTLLDKFLHRRSPRETASTYYPGSDASSAPKPPLMPGTKAIPAALPPETSHPTAPPACNEQPRGTTDVQGISHAPTASRSAAVHPYPPASNSYTNPQQPAQDSTRAVTPSNTVSTQIGQIPAADLAPIYNYVQDCRACRLQLAAAQQNASDDSEKIAALTRERDAALAASNGGGFWLRLKRNTHWLAIGAALGTAASTAALCGGGHRR